MSPYENKAARIAERWATLGWVIAAVLGGILLTEFLNRCAQ